MRTTDFSAAPDLARAGAMFVGATRYRGPHSWLRLAGRYRAMVKQLRRMPGYLGHRVFWEAPWTLGTIGWFETMEDLLRFARTGAHRELMLWVTDTTKHADGGWIRIYTADAHGYTNGRWRAEDGVMASIDRFTPLGAEDQGPPVQRERRS